MTIVYVSIGSNVDRTRNIRLAAKQLQVEYGPLMLSSVYESDPVGFTGEHFFNLVAGFQTRLSPGTVTSTLHSMETLAKRTRNGDRYGPRTLDLDLLLYGDRVIHENGMRIPREEIRQYAFVLAPLAEIAGERLHPTEGKTLANLWQSFDKQAQPIRAVPFDFEL